MAIRYTLIMAWNWLHLGGNHMKRVGDNCMNCCNTMSFPPNSLSPQYKDAETALIGSWRGWCSASIQSFATSFKRWRKTFEKTADMLPPFSLFFILAATLPHCDECSLLATGYTHRQIRADQRGGGALPFSWERWPPCDSKQIRGPLFILTCAVAKVLAQCLWKSRTH